MQPLFLVSDGLDRPCELDWSTPDRPVVRIRRGQVFTAEFAQLLSDVFLHADSTPAPREPMGARRGTGGSSLAVEALAGVLSAHAAVLPERPAIG